MGTGQPAPSFRDTLLRRSTRSARVRADDGCVARASSDALSRPANKHVKPRAPREQHHRNSSCSQACHTYISEQGDPARTWPDGGWLRGCHTRDRASNGTARWVLCARPTASPTPGEAAIDAWDGCCHDALTSRKHLRKHLHRCSSLLLGGGRESCVGMHPVRRRGWIEVPSARLQLALCCSALCALSKRRLSPAVTL